MGERNRRARWWVLAIARGTRFNDARGLRPAVFGTILDGLWTGRRRIGLVAFLNETRDHPCAHAPQLACGDEDALCSRVGKNGDEV